VRIGDVAFVHDSFPPHINMVRVDGANAVLMTIVKAGSASTLDVIDGVKALLPRLREILPPEIKLAVVGDQSPFVQSAVHSVIFEGTLAATLTGLMILIVSRRRFSSSRRWARIFSRISRASSSSCMCAGRPGYAAPAAHGTEG
jgi:multidrug efflux pump subunit AcrB